MPDTMPGSQSARKAAPDVLLMAGVILLGFALRAWQIDAQPLRGDEAFSLVTWVGNLREMFGTLATVDPQPPGAVLWFYGWVKTAGATPFAARYPSALASTLTIAAVYAIGRRIAGRRAGALTAFLMAINPYQIWFAQDARSAALWTMISALATWLMLRALAEPGKIGRWALYVVLAALGLYTFYLEAFILVFHNLYALAISVRRHELLPRWAAAQIGVAALVAPWYLQPRLLSGGYRPTAGPVRLPWTFQSFLFGETVPEPLQIWPPEYAAPGPIAFLAIALILLGLAALWIGGPRRAALFVTLYAFVPLALLAALETVTGAGYFRVRYLASSAPGWALIMGAGLDALTGGSRTRRWRPVLAAGILTLIAGLNALGVWHYRFNPQFAKAPDVPGLVADLERLAGPQDIIINNSPDPVFTYYYRMDVPWVTLPAPDVDLAAELGRIAAMHDTIWLLPWPGSSWDPDQTVAAWLDQNRLLAGDFTAPSYRIRGYIPFEATEGDITSPLEVTFEGVAALRGYTLTGLVSEGGPGPGDRVVVTLFWEPIDRTLANLTVFVHLLGPPRADGSPLWAQDDHPPQRGHTSTTLWEPGRLLRDTYQIEIPADAPPGSYQIVTGFYDPMTGERVTEISGAGQPIPGAARLIEFTIP
ncbi:MAG: glycosyltransferase family 39 protein [Anaerolineae bacterium]